MHAHPLEARLANVEGAFNQVNERLGGIERRLDGFDLHLDGMDRRLEGVDRRFESMDRRLDSFEHRTALWFDQVHRRFNWLTGIVVGTWITTMFAIILHH